jgi:hypothetical protein
LWDQFYGLVRERIDRHPLGCHRPVFPDRVIFDKLVEVPVLAAPTSASPTAPAQSASCAVAVMMKWIAAGIHDQVHQVPYIVDSVLVE